MGTMEIVLIILGIIVFILSFLLPAGNRDKDQEIERLSEDTIREMVGREVEEAKTKISDIVDETITYAMEKTERSMDRLTNEKMMAVNEYSDTVLAEINKNHKEAVFLYDMLNDKHENLKSTVSEAVKTASEVRQTVKDAEVTAKETEEKVKEVQETVIEVAGNAPKLQETSGWEEKIPEDDFTPIFAERVEIIKQPEEEEKAEAVKRSTRKPRTVRGTKAVQAETEEPEKNTASVEVPEVAVSLNSVGKTGGRNSNERILELHKAGKSNMAIAKELGLGIGEVKLVIDLFEGI
ncbi:MAG: DUF6115 domain-containing protein [Firmicutes bacterium]|nr:DUF6115 domain-containing protein [Bacillota bacterium]